MASQAQVKRAFVYRERSAHIQPGISSVSYVNSCRYHAKSMLGFYKDITFIIGIKHMSETKSKCCALRCPEINFVYNEQIGRNVHVKTPSPGICHLPQKCIPAYFSKT